MNNKKAVVLISGGIDSTTVLALLKNQGYEIYGISFNYGQRHKFEITAVQKIANAYKIHSHKIFNLDFLRDIKGSALTDNDIKVPKAGLTASIPVTYVPARNTIFLSIALSYAEAIGAYDIFYGANAIDYSNYPDCRPDYVEAFQNLANYATRDGVTGNQITIHAPIINMTKAQIIKTGLELGVDYSITSSCYDPNEQGHACGKCDSCIIRIKGFETNGMIDPIQYQIGLNISA